MDITIHCTLCESGHTTSIDVPEGWKTRYDGADVEDGFCPKHAVIAEFCDDQCPGCVGGWGDCDLFRSFAYSKSLLTDEDHAALCRGYCPKRTNGTFRVSGGSIEDINLSQAAKNGGENLSKAIREYVNRYALPTPPEGE